MNEAERSRAGGEKKRVAKIFVENGPLLPVTRHKIDTCLVTLTQDKLTPWRWFNSRGIEIANFYGKPMSLHGVVYAGSVMLMFWKFIDPFLKDAMVRILAETAETCRAKNYEPEPHLSETAMLLRGHLISPIYSEMADIDRHLRGKGNPKSVPRRDVTDEITCMERVLDKLLNEFIVGTTLNQSARGDAAGLAKRISRTEANIRAREYLAKKPNATARDLAEGLGCSLGLVAKLPAWKAVVGERKAGRKPKTPRAFSLTKKVETSIGVGEQDEVLNTLIREQEADGKSDGSIDPFTERSKPRFVPRRRP